MQNIASKLTVTDMVIVWNFAVMSGIFGPGIFYTLETKQITVITIAIDV